VQRRWAVNPVGLLAHRAGGAEANAYLRLAGGEAGSAAGHGRARRIAGLGATVDDAVAAVGEGRAAAAAVTGRGAVGHPPGLARGTVGALFGTLADAMPAYLQELAGGATGCAVRRIALLEPRLDDAVAALGVAHAVDSEGHRRRAGRCEAVRDRDGQR